MGTFEVGLNEFCTLIFLQANGSHGMECGRLNVIDPHNLIGSGTVRRCGFVGVGIVLLEEACHCENRL